MPKVQILPAVIALAATVGLTAPVPAQPVAMMDPDEPPPFQQYRGERPLPRYVPPQSVPQYDRSAPPSAPERSASRPDAATPAEMPARLRRQIVDYPTREAPGTIVIDTANTHLYLVQGQGRAIRYGIGVGREGFTWSGRQTINRKQEWPDWHPPQEMIDRQPYLPRFMAGGPGNPLGARAMYLGGTLYRIHGTSEPHTIGQRVSSGCIRMLNEDVVDLYDRTPIGAKVVVLPDDRRQAPVQEAAIPQREAARDQYIPRDQYVPREQYVQRDQAIYSQREMYAQQRRLPPPQRERDPQQYEDDDELPPRRPPAYVRGPFGGPPPPPFLGPPPFRSY